MSKLYYSAVLEAATRKLNRQKKANRQLNERKINWDDDEDEYRPTIYDLPAGQKMEEIRLLVSDDQIVDELVNYMSSNKLNDFANHLIKIYDLDTVE